MRIPIHSKPGSNRSILLAIVFAITLAGCAVLTVDVDVYKGPLSNHPEVQLQQAVAMATAATPLLVQLRDESEVLFALQLKRHGWWLLPASLSKVSQDVTKWRSDHLTAI